MWDPAVQTARLGLARFVQRGEEEKGLIEAAQEIRFYRQQAPPDS